MPAMPKPLFEETEPKFEWMLVEGCDTLHVHLPGYLKENMKVQVTTSGNLRVIGVRKGNDGKSNRFLKEFSLPKDCDVGRITAKFEGGVLRVRLPKVAGSAVQKEQNIQEETKNTSSSAALAAENVSAPEDEKSSDKADKPLPKAVDEQETEGDGNGGENSATEEKYKKTIPAKTWMKKVTLLGLAVVILGVGVTWGIGMIQTKECMCQMVNDMWRVTVNPSQNICQVSSISEM